MGCVQCVHVGGDDVDPTGDERELAFVVDHVAELHEKRREKNASDGRKRRRGVRVP